MTPRKMETDRATSTYSNHADVSGINNMFLALAHEDTFEHENVLRYLQYPHPQKNPA
jgi:hypothetical protein